MKQAELIDAIANKAGITKKGAKDSLSLVVGEIKSQLKAGNEVRLEGLGIFKPTTTTARKGRNPRTGEPMEIAARAAVKFKPSTSILA